MSAGTSRLDKYWVRDRAFYKKVLVILIPIVLQSVINQGVNMMDTVMVGRLGEASISASSLANQFYNIFVFLCMGISAAGLVLASQYFGAGDLKTVRRVFDLILQIVLIGGTVFALLSFFLPEQIIRVFTHEEDVVKLGADYVFIFGKLGMPALGVMGAAVGTLIARLVEFTFCAVYLLKKEKVLQYRPSGLLKKPSKLLFSEFRRLGMPAIISDSLLALAASAISIILGHMGKEIVSAYAIVTVVDRMATVAIQGVSSASGVIIGQTVGEGEFDRAQKEGWTFLILSVLIGLIGAVLVLVLGEWSIGLYEITPETAQITTSMMLASAIIVFFQAIQSALSKGILRGGGDTKFLMIADIIFQWVASIPLGALAGLVLGLDPFWVLIALRIDFIIKSVWLVFRLKSGKWIHKARSMEGAE